MINKKSNKSFKEVVTYDLDKMKYSCDDIFWYNKYKITNKKTRKW